MNDREAAMRHIQICAFAINDAILFLDANPHDQDALNYYDKYRAMYFTAVAEYEKKYGPLTIYGNAPCCSQWNWGSSPWPWQSSC